MTIVKDIIKLLKTKELTTVELATKLGIKAGYCSVYLNTLRKEGRIIKVSEDGKVPYAYTTFKHLLKQIYDFMSDEKKCELGELDEFDIKLLETIKREIK